MSDTKTISTVTITVDGREVQAEKGKPLIHACHGEGVDVPHYCYHPGLTPVGSCRICQVEVQMGEMPGRVMVACRTPVAEGMVVSTQTPKAKETRRECLEFLLKNHPLDCPICDKAGECTLQDYSFDENQGEGRSVEPRRNLEKRKDLGDVIMLDQERCILCSRCVRFQEEIPKKPQLVVADRGSHSTIEVWNDRPMTGKYQGNLADICPVGALTLKPFRFQARVWNLTKTASACGECSKGCATTAEVLRKGEVKRFRPRYDGDVNEWWMCDIGRFAMDNVNFDERLPGGLLPNVDRGWEIVDAHAALGVTRDMLLTHTAPLIVVSPWMTNEEGAAVKTLGEHIGARLTFVSPAANDEKDDLLHTGDPCPNRRGLTELGFEALDAEAALAAAAASASSMFIGERLGMLLGADALAELPTAGRVILMSCEPLLSPAIDVAFGIPNQVERTGTWTNVDGIARQLLPARQMPAGVWTTERLIETLDQMLTGAAEAKA